MAADYIRELIAQLNLSTETYNAVQRIDKIIKAEDAAQPGQAGRYLKMACQIASCYPEKEIQTLDHIAGVLESERLNNRNPLPLLEDMFDHEIEKQNQKRSTDIELSERNKHKKCFRGHESRYTSAIKKDACAIADNRYNGNYQD